MISSRPLDAFLSALLAAPFWSTTIPTLRAAPTTHVTVRDVAK